MTLSLQLRIILKNSTKGHKEKRCLGKSKISPKGEALSTMVDI
jgi:hypothetical protein